MKIGITVFITLILSSFSFADEIKLSYLEIKQSNIKTYSILLKVPMQDKQRLPIDVVLPKECTSISAKIASILNKTYLLSWNIKCPKGLTTNTLLIKGLKRTETQLLLRIELLSSISHSIILSPVKSSYRIPKEVSSWDIIQTYLWLGITHILLGFDHLLFVFTLLLIVRTMRRLLWTITAFTLAHSLTMAVATLGIVHIPQAPIEALIALSILFLATEIIHEKQGKIGWTSRYPWMIAFILGLLHGFGFAGALSDIGLPQQAISLALIFFNLGVEVGQLLFVSSIILFVLVLKHLNYLKALKTLKVSIIYIIGGVSSYWVIERILSF